MNSFALSQFHFDLPDALIAREPVHPRDASRLLLVCRKTGKISHHEFSEFPALIPPHTWCVANNTRVIPARLLGTRDAGNPAQSPGQGNGKIEALLLREDSPGIWECSFKSSAKQKAGLKFFVPGHGVLEGEILHGEIVRGVEESQSIPGAGTVLIRFDRDPTAAGFGHVPLPHYMDRRDIAADVTDYQTVYAKADTRYGSAAAPTAGLHFSHEVLNALQKAGHNWREVTLQVGLGTFRPVKTEDIRNHVMHPERYEMSETVANELTLAKARSEKILAVGTTSLRTLESAWNAELQCFQSGSRETSVFFYPGGPKTIQCVDTLLTNFHLPGSTLLMLVSAFAGRELILKAYAEAVKERYRFFSYGDAMLIV